MSFLKEENEEPPKFITLSDVLTLAVIAILGFGGYYYFKWAKSDSEARLSVALEVYEKGTRLEAYNAFLALEGMQWKSDSLDSIIYEKQSILLDIVENQGILFDAIKDKLEKNDSAGFKILMKEWKGTEFLSAAKQKQVEAWKKSLETEVVVDSALADTTKK